MTTHMLVLLFQGLKIEASLLRIKINQVNRLMIKDQEASTIHKTKMFLIRKR